MGIKDYYLTFNEDASCFAFMTKNKRFIVYNTDPLKERFHRDLDNGYNQIIELYQKTNIVFLVKNDLILVVWDDRQNQALTELPFNAKIINLKCRGNKLMIQTLHKIYILQIENLAILIEYPNTSPLVDFASNDTKTVTAFCPANGKLQLEVLDHPELTKSLTVHSNPISNIALTADGDFIATSSQKGTLIRIWDTSKGTLERELRRGVENANIQQLAFSQDHSSILVYSDKGTIHLYRVHQTNKKSNFAFMKPVLPVYFKSEWSLVSFFHPIAQEQLLAFGNNPNTIVMIENPGKYTKYIMNNNEVSTVESSNNLV
jgi:WD40 repeat protein